MCLLIEKKNILINLKVKITEALRALSEEDRALLAVKFGKNKRELYLSRRTYFRRLNGALSAFEAELARQGVTEGAIADYYGKNIFMIGVIYDEVCEEEQIKLQVAKKLKVNRSYSSTLTGVI
jgi:hypothetical protein